MLDINIGNTLKQHTGLVPMEGSKVVVVDDGVALPPESVDRLGIE